MKSVSFLFLLAAGCDLAVGLTREYIFIGTGLSWNDAQAYCRLNYKDLATITTMEENNQLLSACNSYVSWIGLHKTSGIWEWSDGEKTSLFNWYGNYPTDDCAVSTPYYYSYQGKWITYSCSTPLTFCCYRFLVLVKEKKTWNEAQEYCKSYYTGLASVTSRWTLQQLNLESAMETGSIWTGLHFVDGQWLWMSKEQAWGQIFILGQSLVQSPTESLASMPSCPALAYRCGALNTKTKTFKNQNCNEKLNFICYWD